MAIVVAGPSGSGKTTLGRALAAALGWQFLDADDLHPPANIAKMAAGHALEEPDREPWLAAVAARIAGAEAAGRPTVVACSALRRAHRDRLRACGAPVAFVWLDAPPDVLAARLTVRQNHFMPASLLPSQLATAEPPGPDEPAVVLDSARPLGDLVAAVLQAHPRA